MRSIAAVAISVSLLTAQSDHSALTSVTAVRHWTSKDATRIAVEVSGDFTFVTERLHNPERIYFDIPASRPRLESRRIYAATLDDARVHRIRVAETLPGVTRVVLDLAGPVEAITSQLSNPSRLIIELRAGTGLIIPTERPPAVAPPSVSPVVTAVTAPPPPAAPSSVPAKTVRPFSLPPAPVVRSTPPPRIAEAPKVDFPRTSRPDTNKLSPILTARIPARPPEKIEIPEPIVPSEPRPVSAASTAAMAAEIGKAARHTASGQTSLVRALGLKLGRVVIDPGHGGHDQGTQGPKGLAEKELVLDVARRVGKMIEDRLNAEVVYTRNDDTYIPLEGRTALANEKKADLFLSIHANSSPISRISGVEVYYLNFADSKDAMDVAARENATSQKSIFELRDIIQKITLHDKLEESKEFAGRVQNSLYTLSAKNFPNAKNRGVKRAPFVVLIGASMPSVLAEIGFLSNPREEALLKRPDYRQKLAEALYRGVSKYAESLSHFQVAQAQQ